VSTLSGMHTCTHALTCLWQRHVGKNYCVMHTNNFLVCVCALADECVQEEREQQREQDLLLEKEQREIKLNMILQILQVLVNVEMS
jgi:hypothetical protein